MRLSKLTMKSFIAVLALVVAGCSTVRMSYEAEVKPPGQEKHDVFIFKKSYEVGGPHKVLCIVTGILYGGWCWYYISLPNEEQVARIEKDARVQLDRIYGKGQYTAKRTLVDVESWGEGKDQSQLIRSNETANLYEEVEE